MYHDSQICTMIHNYLTFQGVFGVPHWVDLIKVPLYDCDGILESRIVSTCLPFIGTA